MYVRANTVNVANITPVTRQKSDNISANLLNKRRIGDIIYFLSDDIKQYQQIIKILGPHHKNSEILKDKILNKLAENNYEIIQFILNKKKRTNEELIIIKTFLSTMKSLSLMINITEPDKILFSLSMYLKLESKIKDSILFRYGDKGTKFYILLSGKVSILILKETRVEMSFLRYFLHLLLLQMMKEKELVKKTIIANYKQKNHLDEITFDIIYNKIVKFVRKNFGKNAKKKENDLEDDSFDESEQVSEIETKKKFDSPIKKKATFQLNYLNNDNSSNYKFEVKDRIRVEEIKPLKSKLRKRMSIGFPSASRNNILEAAKLKSLNKNAYDEMNFPIFTKVEELKEIISYYLYLKTVLVNVRKDKISLKDYINNTYINSIFRKNLNEDDDIEEDLYSIYIYHEIVQKNKGDTFGELALQHEDSKRTATILATTDIILGYLSKNDYETCLNEIQLKRRRNEVNFIISFSIFDKMNWISFEKKYFNFFKREYFSQGETVLKQGEKIKKIIFIMEGQFEITSSLSLDNLYKIIKQKTTSSFKKISLNTSNKKNFLRLCISNNKDIIGLNDCSFLGLFNEEISFINATCTSNKSVTFTLEKSILNDLENKIGEIKQNLKQININREKVMIDRLSSFFDQLIKNKKWKKMGKENVSNKHKKNISLNTESSSAINNYLKSKILNSYKKNEEILPQYRNFLLSAKFRRSRELAHYNDNKVYLNLINDNNYSIENLTTDRKAFSSKIYKMKDIGDFEENKNSIYLKWIETENNIDDSEYKKKITNIMAIKENNPKKLNPRLYLKSAVSIREVNEKTNIREKMKNLYLPLNNIINKEYKNLFKGTDYNKKLFDSYKKIKDDDKNIDIVNSNKDDYKRISTDINKINILKDDSKRKLSEKEKEKITEEDNESEFGDSKKLSFSSDNEENKNDKSGANNKIIYNNRYDDSNNNSSKNINSILISIKRHKNMKIRRTLKSLEMEEEMKNMFLNNLRNKNKKKDSNKLNLYPNSLNKYRSNCPKNKKEYEKNPYNKMSLLKKPFNNSKSKNNSNNKTKNNESYLKQILGTRYRNEEDDFISRTEKRIVKEINDYNADLKWKKEVRLKLSKKIKENKSKNNKNTSRYLNGDYNNEQGSDLLLSNNFNIKNLKKSYEKKK